MDLNVRYQNINNIIKPYVTCNEIDSPISLFLSYLGKTISTKSPHNHQIDVFNFITPLTQVLTNHSKDTCFKMCTNIFSKVSYVVVFLRHPSFSQSDQLDLLMICLIVDRDRLEGYFNKISLQCFECWNVVSCECYCVMISRLGHRRQQEEVSLNVPYAYLVEGYVQSIAKLFKKVRLKTD